MRDDDEQMDIEDVVEEVSGLERGGNDTAKLTYIVGRHAELAKKIQEAKWEQKELEDSAWEQCGYSAKAVKQLSKESAWDEVKREQRKQLEEEIDKGRAALGLLADTPLGQAEMERMERQQHEPATPRKRGRPPGSRNKPRSLAGELPPAA